MALVIKSSLDLRSSVTQLLALQPAVRGQNRLEGFPRAEDFSRSLRAEVRDPMWFLTRQWQFGEFKGDDAGSPIDARIKMTRRKLTTYAPRESDFGPIPQDLPMETVVEREVIPMDLITQRQIASAMRRALESEGLSKSHIKSVIAFLLTAYPLEATSIEGHGGQRAQQMLPAILAQVFDGGKFLRATAVGEHDNAVDAEGTLSASLKSAAKEAAQVVATMFKNLYSQPDESLPSAWNAQQLEYQFACETINGTKGDHLFAQDYASGRLDWPAFDFVKPRSGNTNPKETTEVMSFIPTAVTFAGMPSPRFWEMEDRHVEFADINAATTDVGKLLLTEFALSYANDWVMFPVEVETGSLCEVEGVLVRNVFGESSLIRAVGRGEDDDWQRWSMFGLSTFEESADRRLFVPQTTPISLEPDPIERIVLLRDQMANMCWAVERTVPSQCGAGLAGATEADAEVVEAVEDPIPDGSVRYTLGSEPPSNWIPFVPVHTPGSDRSIRLQRARLPGGDRGVKGTILNEPGPYFINEEEFPRSGKIISRGFQRCRWENGEIVQWLGRKVEIGQGEGSSGMLFDMVKPI